MQPQTPDQQQRILVLVVEDHPVNRKVVSRMLENMGCRVELAEDGLVGVERAAACPDLILMDCSMPRCDGLEATRRIRALPGAAAHSAIVALTAHAMPGDKERCIAASMDDWLSKPLSPNDLAFVLKKFTAWTGPTEVASTDGTFDRRAIDQLLDLASDDPEFFTDVVNEFSTAANSALEQAWSQLEDGNQAELRRTIHRLKSASATVGATRLHTACHRLEVAEQLPGAELLLQAIAQEVNLALAALRSEQRNFS